MQNLLLSLIVFFSFIDASLASGSYVGNGGDTILCKSSPENNFQGHYTLDYLLEFRETNLGPLEITDFSETIDRLNLFLGQKYPELLTHFNQFMEAVRGNQVKHGRHWLEEESKLIDIEDENIQKLIPANCLDEKNGEYRLKLHQTVIRESIKDPIIYHYDKKILEELEAKNPLQYSFFIVHEWLWDLTRDVRSVRSLNWLFHSEELHKMSRSELSKMFDRFDVFKVKLNFCERSTQIKNLLNQACESVDLNTLAEVMSINFTKSLKTPFRMGDFFGFGRVINMSMSRLNLNTSDLLPRIFYPLYTLKSLDLSHNKIDNLSEEVTVDLMNLKNLDLSHNPLKTIPNSMLKLKKLETLTMTLCESILSEEKEVNNLPSGLSNLVLISLNSDSRKIEEVLKLLKKLRPQLNVSVKK